MIMVLYLALLILIIWKDLKALWAGQLLAGPRQTWPHKYKYSYIIYV